MPPRWKVIIVACIFLFCASAVLMIGSAAFFHQMYIITGRVLAGISALVLGVAIFFFYYSSYTQSHGPGEETPSHETPTREASINEVLNAEIPVAEAPAQEANGEPDEIPQAEVAPQQEANLEQDGAILPPDADPPQAAFEINDANEKAQLLPATAVAEAPPRGASSGQEPGGKISTLI